MSSPETPLTGADRIAAYLKTLPDAPGVYRMMNAAGDVLYVGKAKSLKKRVSSYARGGAHSDRITRMVAETAEMLFVTTASETEALLLESNLIKRLKPRYNVSYRDDKSFPNILLREDHPYPQLLKHRGAKTIKGVYYGPFASAGAVERGARERVLRVGGRDGLAVGVGLLRVGFLRLRFGCHAEDVCCRPWFDRSFSKNRFDETAVERCVTLRRFYSMEHRNHERF